eukprot:2653912-Rhodomonas_salina.1
MLHRLLLPFLPLAPPASFTIRPWVALSSSRPSLSLPGRLTPRAPPQAAAPGSGSAHTRLHRSEVASRFACLLLLLLLFLLAVDHVRSPAAPVSTGLAVAGA